MKIASLMLLLPFFTTAAQANCFQLAANQFALDAEILYSIAKVESSVKGDVLSMNTNRTIDIGMMQINTIHRGVLAQAGVDLVDLLDPCINITVGAWLLKEAISASNGGLWQGVGRYHSKTKHLGEKYSNKVKSTYENLTEHDRLKLRLM